MANNSKTNKIWQSVLNESVNAINRSINERKDLGLDDFTTEIVYVDRHENTLAIHAEPRAKIKGSAMLCNTDIVCIELDLVKDFDDDMVTDLSMVKNFTRTLNRSLDGLYTPVINKTEKSKVNDGYVVCYDCTVEDALKLMDYIYPDGYTKENLEQHIGFASDIDTSVLDYDHEDLINAIEILNNGE